MQQIRRRSRFEKDPGSSLTQGLCGKSRIRMPGNHQEVTRITCRTGTRHEGRVELIISIQVKQNKIYLFTAKLLEQFGP